MQEYTAYFTKKGDTWREEIEELRIKLSRLAEENAVLKNQIIYLRNLILVVEKCHSKAEIANAEAELPRLTALIESKERAKRMDWML
jgi:hypothetical protein